MEYISGNIDDITEEEYNSVYNSLSLSRKERIKRKKLEINRKQSLMGELLIKQLLIKQGFKNAVIECEENGRPCVVDLPLYISISHCKNMVAVAVSNEPVGIDIEKIKSIDMRITEKICTKEEKIFIEQSENNEEAFFEVWTAKEAYYKMQSQEKINFKEINTLNLRRRKFKKDDYIIQIVY